VAKREDPLVSALRNVPLFEDLRGRELREVGHLLQRRTYKSGDTVFEQGQPGVGLYLVLSGAVDVLQGDEDGIRLRLSEAGEGSFFGEMALLDDSARTASAVATEDTELAVFFRSDLLSLAEQRPSVAAKIVMRLSQIVAERLRRTNRALREARDQLEAAHREPVDVE
jgi:CRP-like cAMP-binding protein